MYPLRMGSPRVLAELKKTAPSGWKLRVQLLSDGTVKEWAASAGESSAWHGTWSAQRDAIGRPTARLHVVIGKYKSYYCLTSDTQFAGVEYRVKHDFKSTMPECIGGSFLSLQTGGATKLMSRLIVLGGCLDETTSFMARFRRGYIERRIHQTQVNIDEDNQKQARNNEKQPRTIRLAVRDARAMQPGYMADLAEAINAFRVREGTYPLEVNSHLCSAANAKARHMRENKYHAHISPDGVGPQSFVEATQYDGWLSGENILHRNQPTGIKMFESWEGSPGHRWNMLQDHQAFGVGSFVHNDSWASPGGRTIRTLGVTHFGGRR